MEFNEKETLAAVHQAVERFGTFGDDQLSLLSEKLRRYDVPKGSSIIAEGQVCKKFVHVNSGCFRQYRLEKDGDETTVNLFVEKDWMFEQKSFMSQRPSETIIEAMEESNVFELSVVDFHALVKSSDSFFRMGRIFDQAVQAEDFKNNRLTPEEKYERLIANKPKVIQKFPLKYIASFLGIAPETLSRVRRKVIS